MKCLSVNQPWTYAIFSLGKDVENRTWRTKHRGPVLIHASKAPQFSRSLLIEALEVRLRMCRETVVEHMKTLLEDERWIPSAFAPLHAGGIVGRVDIVDCVRDHDSPWAMPGHWHWVLENKIILPFRPCKGALGFFAEPAL